MRAVEGLHGIDYLAESSIAKKQSYVFGHVISVLIDVGFDPTNLLVYFYFYFYFLLFLFIFILFFFLLFFNSL